MFIVIFMPRPKEMYVLSNNQTLFLRFLSFTHSIHDDNTMIMII